MKKIFSFTLLIFALSFSFPTFSFAQGMMSLWNSSSDNASIQSQQQEEQEGKSLLDELSNKTVPCAQLNDSDFEKIGEYFMGQSIGDTGRHIVMNEMMKRMMGEKGEEQMHAVMGKRSSGCDSSAAFPEQDIGFMPMAYMMGGFTNPSSSNNYFTNPNSMMNFGFLPFGGFSWIFMILWWILIIAGIAMLVKWLMSQSGGTRWNHEKTSLDILKERYAKGEINKKEFEEKRKDVEA
ncbi:SHOCT domain-containing protein [Candidatus Peregrinibacteria bacterium]|nr:SHOCT domain-containing protein [Candidatus Peregrinibacteria bacterium]